MLGEVCGSPSARKLTKAHQVVGHHAQLSRALWVGVGLLEGCLERLGVDPGQGLQLARCQPQ